MSHKLRNYLAKVFYTKEQSDCTIAFYVPCFDTPIGEEAPPDNHQQQSKSRQRKEAHANETLCPCPPPSAPLPVAPTTQSVEPSSSTICELAAHLVVLCGASPRFRAQVLRWTQDLATSSGQPILLRVPLDSADELPFALSALRFMYTDSLDVNTVDALLRVRRLASYLQIEGCCEACDASLASLIVTSTSATSTAPPTHADALGGVLALYTRRQLLPDGPDGGDEASHLNMLRACQQQLVQQSSAVVNAEAPLMEGGSGPCFGDLLAWAFRDAPRALSDPETKKNVEALPLNAIEALLRSQSFATDDEATVLLLIAVWLAAHDFRAGQLSDAKARLSKVVRLSHLDPTFMHIVLPGLVQWFPISPEELNFLCSFVHAPLAQREQMAAAAVGTYNCTSAWYASPRRPTLPAHAVRSYDWAVQAKDLQDSMALSATAQTGTVEGKFCNGAKRVFSRGLEWYPYVHYDKAKDSAGVYLKCSWPQAFNLPNTDKIVAFTHPGSGCLEVFEQVQGAGPAGVSVRVAWRKPLSDTSYIRVGWSLGDAAALPLLTELDKLDGYDVISKGTALVGSPLAPWRSYITSSSGALQGRLAWGA